MEQLQFKVMGSLMELETTGRRTAAELTSKEVVRTQGC